GRTAAAGRRAGGRAVAPGQGEADAGPAPRSVRGPDPAAVGADDGVADRQAEAEAALAGPAPIELLEDALLGVPGEAGPLVGHLDRHRAVVGGGGDQDRRSG